MEGKESFFGKMFKQIKDRFGSKKIERSKQAALEILDDIIPASSSVQEFKDIYSQLEHGGTLADVVSETKKYASEPLMPDQVGEVKGVLSEEDQCLTIGAEHKDGEIYVGQVRGFFRTETGAEGIAALVRRSKGTKPVMWMVASGPEADEYSFRFGYR